MNTSFVLYFWQMQKKGILLILSYAIIVSIISCWRQKNFSEKSNEFFEDIPSNIRDSIYLFEGNQLTKEKVKLGRYLFYDRRLSINNTKACATCHAQEFSFTDNYKRSIGALGDLHRRNSKPLINLVFDKYLTSADSTIHFPEQQINHPMFNILPIEMGWKGSEKTILEKIKHVELYQKLFKESYPGVKEPFTVNNIQRAISSFIKSIISLSSPYDKFLNKKETLDESQIRGKILFFSNQLACATCHGGINFNKASGEMQYFNTGLYYTTDEYHYPEGDKGLYELTKNPDDVGKFKVPTLRNLAYTAPYYHDGSAATLEDVLKVYENGGRVIHQGINNGDGRRHPNKSKIINGFKLNSQQRIDLINFLLSLTDSSVISNPAYSNPFLQDETH